MVKGQLQPVLRHIHELAVEASHQELTDGELLESFASRREEAAFEALIRRHGSMVLGVCRRLLHDGHAAEDAFQATFLVLFRRVHALDRRGSVASWLYKVAYHVALKAKADNARHRLHREVPDMPRSEAPAEAIWRDLQPVLDEELNRLPDHYRAPILLCYVEGKTNQEAARMLGWPVGTVKGRLARARQLLRSRLTRRGITLSAAAIGAMLADHAHAAVPPLLLEATVRTTVLVAAGEAAGAASPAAVNLANGVLKAMIVSKIKIATALLLAVGLAAVATGAFTHQALAQRSLKESPSAGSPAAKEAGKPGPHPGSSSAAAKPNLVVTGRVVDPNGNPVASGRVGLIAWRRYPGRIALEPMQPQASIPVQVDGEGRFLLTREPTSAREHYSLHASAAAAGYGFGWQALDPDAERPEVVIRLLPECVLRGRLLDLQGQPAANVKIQLTQVVTPKDEYFSWGEKTRSTIWPEPVTTDTQGRFVMHGIGQGLRASLKIRDDRFEPRSVEVVTKDGQSSQEVPIVLGPARLLQGQITCEETGKPIPRASLTVWASSYRGDGDGKSTDAQADEHGCFRLQPYAGPFCSIHVATPRDGPNLGITKDLEWPRGVLKQEVNIALPRGVLVRGLVTELPSGQPVPGADVVFRPERANLRSDILTGSSHVVLSGADGRFQMAVPAVPGHLFVQGPTPDYVHHEVFHDEVTGKVSDQPRGFRRYPDGLVRLDLKPGAEPAEAALTFRRGVTAHGRVVGPNGQSVSGGWMMARSLIPFPVTHRKIGPDGRFELPGCDPEKSQTVFFLDARNEHGALVEVSGKQAGSEPVTIKLVPCGAATTRFVDKQGQPRANHRPMMFQLVITPGHNVSGDTIGKGLPLADFIAVKSPSTDAEGRITFAGLIPGATYRVIGPIGPGYGVKKDFVVESGKPLALPDIVMDR